MSEQSAKPYLSAPSANGAPTTALTPYLAVKVDARTRVPMAFVKNGEIVLNVSTTATRKLTIDNDWVQFNARFSGARRKSPVPMSAVSGIFAKETGYGFAFAMRRRIRRPRWPPPPRRRSRRSSAGAERTAGNGKTDGKPKARAVAPAGHQIATIGATLPGPAPRRLAARRPGSCRISSRR